MEIQDIEKYLSVKRTSMDLSVKEQIDNERLAAIAERNEDSANYLWCLRQIYIIQHGFLCAFEYLKNKKYEDAWNKFDTIDMEIGFLEENYSIDVQNDKFHLVFIGQIIKEYQKLFPYLHFLSRENIIKSEECSICGAPVSFRKRCGHKPGKVYMGELCLRKVTDMEFKAMAIVTDPFDKYAYITIPDKEFDYGMLDWLMTYVKSPYDSFYIETRKEKKPEYIKIGRNAPCPCGSGKKYKKCHLGQPSELMDHHVVHMAGTKEQQTKEIRYFGTWK